MSEVKLSLKSLRVKDFAVDKKISALNVFGLIKVQDYLEIAQTIKNNNDLQRRRVSNPSTVYALLKEDMINGCLIPSIVLALDRVAEFEFDYSKIDQGDYTEILESIQKYATSLKILDGLQRTNILLDLEEELKQVNEKSEEEQRRNAIALAELYERELRVEIYLNITRFGILYRMLTLNTGQTPMSLRHQIEILYSDYYIEETNGITLMRDAFDTKKQVKIGCYRFSDVVEGVTSFIDGSEFTLDRFDLLDYIKSLKKLSVEKNKSDIFESFVTTYHTLILKVDAISDNWNFEYEKLSKERLDYFPIQKKDAETGKVSRTAAFGDSAADIFLKQQIFTGLGSALSFLKQKNVISEINDIQKIIEGIKFEDTPSEALDNLVVRLEQIRKESKKIGESQRTFFKHFFISMFNKNDNDSFLIFEKATEIAYRKTV